MLFMTMIRDIHGKFETLFGNIILAAGTRH